MTSPFHSMAFLSISTDTMPLGRVKSGVARPAYQALRKFRARVAGLVPPLTLLDRRWALSGWSKPIHTAVDSSGV